LNGGINVKKCKHECVECGKTWECSHPYQSEYQFFENTVNSGYYCNSFCPSCQVEDREEIELLFERTSETGYTNTFATRNKGLHKEAI
jgi:hypothetical protein